MKNLNARRETIAKAHNVTSAIKKRLAKKDESTEKVDLANLAENLADRRDKVLSGDGK